MSDNQVFNLAKDQIFSLTKLSPGIKDYYVGLDWDPAKAGNSIDLDAVLIAVGKDGKVIPGKAAESFLFYGNNGRNGSSPAAFSITEDNRDGSDDFNNTIDDDEAIFVRGDLVEEEMSELRIFVSFHDANGLTLEDVSKVSLRIAPLNGDTPDFNNQAVFDVRECGAGEGAHMATLVRNEVSGWDIITVGQQSGSLANIASVHGIETR